MEIAKNEFGAQKHPSANGFSSHLLIAHRCLRHGFYFTVYLYVQNCSFYVNQAVNVKQKWKLKE